MEKDECTRKSLEEFIQNIQSSSNIMKNQNQAVIKRIEYYRDDYCDDSQFFYSMYSM